MSRNPATGEAIKVAFWVAKDLKMPA